ncbi:unnamed protein product, partial [Rotaria sp. Silwood1]
VTSELSNKVALAMKYEALCEDVVCICHAHSIIYDYFIIYTHCVKYGLKPSIGVSG